MGEVWAQRPHRSSHGLSSLASISSRKQGGQMSHLGQGIRCVTNLGRQRPKKRDWVCSACPSSPEFSFYLSPAYLNGTETLWAQVLYGAAHKRFHSTRDCSSSMVKDQCAWSLSRVQLFVTPWSVARQAPLSMGIHQARILEWVAVPSSRGSSQPGMEARSPTLQVDSLLTIREAEEYWSG